ncbi:MAG: hypothetical protein P1U38_01985 [Aeromicrobium sp.]|uniref:hypothetical protein n=1 Tax=Aeromicrobium sp. TaxID=1871063 RepID=UPI00262EDF27|nr:hypothetical protein [Aeromicrobium sp.]MDF1703527.1 hypothetical protein [Aeromicrobium sp.]
MPNAVSAVLRLLGPKVAAIAGPAVIAWLARPENREQAAEVVRGLQAKSATQRLMARIDLAVVTFHEVIRTSEPDSEHYELATSAIRELHALRIRLQLPFSSLKARSDNRRDVASQLDALLVRTNQAL